MRDRIVALAAIIQAVVVPALLVPALLVSAVLVPAGCGDGAAAATTPAKDAATDGPLSCVHPTPPQDSCQERWCDNELGVGMPCTKSGGECMANKDKGDLGAVLCTATQAKEAFCTLPCVDDEDCGKGAVCRGDPKAPKSGKGCILAACAGPGPEGDATSGSDGGQADASLADTPSATDTASNADTAPNTDTAGPDAGN